MFQLIYTTIITSIQKSLRKGLVWFINSVIDHTISISKYNPLAGSSYIKLLKELDHARKGLLSVQGIDDHECFKLCLVRYLNPAYHSPRRITKGDKDFAKRIYFKDINILVKIRDIHKIEENRIPSDLAFYVMKIRKNIQSMNQNNVVKKNMLTYHW